jgi:hypothetical protein
VQGKTVAWKGPDGTPYLLTQKNHSGTGRVFRRAPSYSQGQVLAVRWDGLTLLPAAEGPKLPGFMADLDVSSSAGRSVLYVAWVRSEGMLFPKWTTRIAAYGLPEGEKP